MDLDALFQDEVRRAGVVPLPLALLDLWQPALMVGPRHVNPSESVREIPDGQGAVHRIKIAGDSAWGLPTVDDFDVLFALLGLAVDLRTNDLSGRFSLADIVRQTGGRVNGQRIAATRMAIKRWSTTNITAESRWMATHLPTALPDSTTPRTPMQRRLKAESEQGWTVLGICKASELLISERVPHNTQRFVDAFVFDPWIVTAAQTAPWRWIDLAATADLTPFQKRLLHRLLWRSVAVPAADPLAGWTQSNAQWIAECGADRDHRRVLRSAIEALRARGLVHATEASARGGTSPLVTLRLGERSAAWVACSKVGPRLPAQTARLLAVMTRAPFGFTMTAAEALIARDAAQTLAALQRVVYSMCADDASPIAAPRAYVEQAVGAGWSFDTDRAFVAWRAAQVAHGGLVARETALSASLTSPASLGATPALPSVTNERAVEAPRPARPAPVNPFERAIEALVSESRQAIVGAYLGQLRPVADPDADGILVVAGDAFHFEFMQRHPLLPQFLTLASASYGTPVVALRYAA